MTTFRKTTGGYAFNIVSGAMVGRDPAIIAWIDSLPPLEPVQGGERTARSPGGTDVYESVCEILGAEPGNLLRRAETVVSERDALKAELAAKDEEIAVLKRDHARGGQWERCRVMLGMGATFDVDCKTLENGIESHLREFAEAKRQIAEATKAADKACEERDAASQAATFELGRLRDELSTLRAQQERMPAKLVERAKAWLPGLTVPEPGANIIRDLAACEPAAMLMVEEAVRVVHDVKRVIVRGTPIPNTVDTFDVEEALRKAAKS